MLHLPEHSLLTSYRYWGVVRVPYLRVGSSMIDDESVNGVLRAGEVVRIIEVRSVYQSSEGFWRDYYHVVNVDDESITGWILSHVVELFAYEEGALRNSIRFKQD